MATQTATRPSTSKVGGPVGAVADADDEPKKGAKGAKKGKSGDGDGKKGGKKKKIIIVVVLLVVIVAAYEMLGSKKSANTKPAPPKPGLVVAMTDTTLNLTDGHFLKVKLGLQTIQGAPADLDTSKASDLLISEFTGQAIASLSTADGRNKSKQDLLTKIEAAYPKQIMDIYFTEFVMQ